MLFREIVGQQEIKQRLIRSVNDQRISHAQLFTGPPGTGKLPLALAYAQYISCENRLADDSCGVCPSCIKYRKLLHPDLHITYPVNSVKDVAVSGERPKSVDFIKFWREAFLQNPYLDLHEWLAFLGIENKQGIINVEESKDIVRLMSLKPFESEFKIVIIWMAEKMNTEASNKLLKIIEEPSPKTLFLLVAESSDQILPTIISRTQLIKVNRITNDDLRVALVARGVEQAVAESVVHIADGNFNEALRLSGAADSESNHQKQFLEWMRACYKKNIQELITWTESIASSSVGREGQKSFLTYALHIIRESIMINYGPPSLVLLSQAEHEAFRKFAPFVNRKNCFGINEEINKACSQIERNANPKILFLDLSLKISRLLELKN